jgi:hypothetical protein
MTNCETFSGIDLECVNMFPLRRGAGGISGRPRLFSLSWLQHERWRQWPKFAELGWREI